MQGPPNYAINPTPEPDLRSNRALLPARVIAALALMTKIALLVLLTAAFAAHQAVGCTTSQAAHRFKPDTETFNRAHDFAIALTVPAPSVKVVSFKRATSVLVGSCRAYALVTLLVSVPEDSIFQITELGFLFRSEPSKPQSRFMAFPNFPIQSEVVSGNAAEFTFYLEDPPENHGRPYSLTLDVTAVNNGLQMSDSTNFTVSGNEG